MTSGIDNFSNEANIRDGLNNRDGLRDIMAPIITTYAILGSLIVS